MVATTDLPPVPATVAVQGDGAERTREESTMITLLCVSCWNSVWFTVTFATEAQAVEYVRTRGDRLAFFTDDEHDQPLVDLAAFPALAEALHPTCEHGLSLSLCYGEGHYPVYGVNTMDPTWR